MNPSILAGTYEGDYLNGKFHGQGTYKYLDTCYVGKRKIKINIYIIKYYYIIKVIYTVKYII